MSFRKHCEDLGIPITAHDLKIIAWRLRMLPKESHKSILEQYIAVYYQALSKENPKNYARHVNALHYANRFIKFYKE